jgi:hypothetical protein
MIGPFKAAPEGGFLVDACHGEVGPGDVFVASYRGRAGSRFVVVSDDGRGMFRFRDPDGVERPMRPSTMLSPSVGAQHVKASPERRAAFEAIAYMREHDCDFLTVENVMSYGRFNSPDVAREALADAGFPVTS